MREILFYRTDSGGNPIEEFLDSLNAKQARKVTMVLRVIEEFERVPKQYFKKLSGTEDIWEIRAQEGREIYRILGFFEGANRIVLVHVFKKKSHKIRSKDITVAERRKRDYLSRIQR
jgi:phage-related protein